MAETTAPCSFSQHRNNDAAFMMCTEHSCPRRAFQDKTFLTDDRVLQNLLTAEDHFLPNSTYFDFQPEIKPNMRQILSRWMLDVCEEQHCEEIFCLAMNYIDRYLAVVRVPKRDFQLLGTACLFVASKLKETYPITADKLVMYTDYSITIDRLLDFELDVCTALKWDISVITPHDFLDQIIFRLPDLSEEIVSTIKRHSRTFIALCSTEISFASYPASMIAAASIMAGAEGVMRKEWCESYGLVLKLQNIISADLDCLQSCQEQIEQLLTENARSQYNCDSPVASSHCLNTGGCKTAFTPTDVTKIEVQ